MAIAETPHTGPSLVAWYIVIGQVLGGLAGLATFVGCWIYCIARYGFLIGVTIGWLPSSIAAAIVGGLVTFLWGPALVIALIVWLAAAHNASGGPGANASPGMDASAIAATAAADASAAASSLAVAPAPAAPAAAPPPDLQRVQAAVDQMETIVPEQGLAGAISYAMKCYAGLGSAATWAGWDHCAAFDQYGLQKFGKADWGQNTQYFDASAVDGRQQRALSGLSTDAAQNQDRIAAIRGLVDQAVSARSARLAAAAAMLDPSSSTAPDLAGGADPSTPRTTPSFDCSRAVSDSVKLVCSTPSLAQADNDLAVAYRAALTATADDGALRASRRPWLRHRNSAAADVDGLEAMYASRTAELRGLTAN